MGVGDHDVSLFMIDDKNMRRVFDATLKCKDRLDFYLCVADAASNVRSYLLQVYNGNSFFLQNPGTWYMYM